MYNILLRMKLCQLDKFVLKKLIVSESFSLLTHFSVSRKTSQKNFASTNSHVFGSFKSDCAEAQEINYAKKKVTFVEKLQVPVWLCLVHRKRSPLLYHWYLQGSRWSYQHEPVPAQSCQPSLKIGNIHEPKGHSITKSVFDYRYRD